MCALVRNDSKLDDIGLLRRLRFLSKFYNVCIFFAILANNTCEHHLQEVYICSVFVLFALR